VLRPGEVLSVGRSNLAGLVLAQDERLAAKHFELSWDGARARLSDLGSPTGTQLNGERATEAEVRHGAWIRAGQSDFKVYVEGHTPPSFEDEEDDEDAPEDAREEPPPFPAEPPEPDPDEDEEAAVVERREVLRVRAIQRVERRAERKERALRDQAADRALPILRATAVEGGLHAILDAARTPRILEALREAVEEHRSLYEGAQSVALDDVAPYLVHLESGSRLLPQLVREGWTRRWGIFLEGEVPKRELRRHLRRFLMVEDDETGEKLYFRFYDPGVLRVFWPSCSRRQRADLLGPLRAFLVEGEHGEVLRLTADGKVEPSAEAGG
jgi:pSer/pThr/pTyr-binding forkhead associated (FHA) protein